MATGRARLTAVAVVAATVLAGCASGPPAAARRSAPTTAISPAASRADVTVLDLSFVGLNDGWALAVSNCTHRPGPCPELLRTTDGAHWRRITMLPFDVAGLGGCGDACVEHLRFANDQLGYAYGPGELYMTTDGGRRWMHQPGGAAALDTLNSNVIRVFPWQPGCTLDCIYTIKTAPNGSTKWEGRSTKFVAYQVDTARGGHDAYVLATPHLSGNGFDTFYRSHDDGRVWTFGGAPCPHAKGVEVHALALTAGAGGRVSVLCWDRLAGSTFLATSPDGVAPFSALPGDVPVSDVALLAGDPAAVLVAAGDGMARSTDGGRSWTRISKVAGQVTFLGFESATVGRVVTDNRAIWTTQDGGATWTPAHLG